MNIKNRDVHLNERPPLMIRLIQKVLFPSRAMSLTEKQKLAKIVSGKTILITGASFGIGESLAYLLAAILTDSHSSLKSPPKLLLIGRTTDKLKQVQSQVLKLGGRAEIYSLDLRDEEQLQQFINYLQTESVDIFINNAGQSIKRSVMQSLGRSHDFQRTISLNYLAPVQLCLSLIPKLKANRGHIINVSALNVLLPPMPEWSAYQASKTAFDQWFRSALPELNANAIDTSTLYLPLVRTRMIAPTTLYRSAPAMLPEQVAFLIGRVMISKAISFKPWWLYIVEPMATLFKAPLEYFVRKFYRYKTHR